MQKEQQKPSHKTSRQKCHENTTTLAKNTSRPWRQCCNKSSSTGQPVKIKLTKTWNISWTSNSNAEPWKPSLPAVKIKITTYVRSRFPWPKLQRHREDKSKRQNRNIVENWGRQNVLHRKTNQKNAMTWAKHSRRYHDTCREKVPLSATR